MRTSPCHLGIHGTLLIHQSLMDYMRLNSGDMRKGWLANLDVIKAVRLLNLDHSSASDASQVRVSSSIARWTLTRCEMIITPGHARLPMKSAKWRGIVRRSCVTRILFSSAARASTSGPAIPLRAGFALDECSDAVFAGRARRHIGLPVADMAAGLNCKRAI